MNDISQAKYLYNIKRKLMLVYILNFTDYIATKILLSTGLFFEGNFFMRNIISENFMSALIKLLLPLLLLTFIYIRIKTANIKQLKYSTIVITGCIIYYALINCTHLIWISIYLYKI